LACFAASLQRSKLSPRKLPEIKQKTDLKSASVAQMAGDSRAVVQRVSYETTNRRTRWATQRGRKWLMSAV
jgi:hypothetical protein